MDRFLTPDEAAQVLRVTPATVRAWLRTGRLPGAKFGEKSWRIPESALDATERRSWQDRAGAMNHTIPGAIAR